MPSPRRTVDDLQDGLGPIVEPVHVSRGHPSRLDQHLGQTDEDRPRYSSALLGQVPDRRVDGDLDYDRGLHAVSQVPVRLHHLLDPALVTPSLLHALIIEKAETDAIVTSPLPFRISMTSRLS